MLPTSRLRKRRRSRAGADEVRLAQTASSLTTRARGVAVPPRASNKRASSRSTRRPSRAAPSCVTLWAAAAKLVSSNTNFGARAPRQQSSRAGRPEVAVARRATVAQVCRSAQVQVRARVTRLRPAQQPQQAAATPTTRNSSSNCDEQVASSKRQLPVTITSKRSIIIIMRASLTQRARRFVAPARRPSLIRQRKS